MMMILLDHPFLGLTYIIVYVGAIMILFLFVIMMVQIHLMPVPDQGSGRPAINDSFGAGHMASGQRQLNSTMNVPFMVIDLTLTADAMHLLFKDPTDPTDRSD